MGRPARVTREQVLRAAREAFSESGYHGTTLAAIGARVGISPAALLRGPADLRSLNQTQRAGAARAGGEGKEQDHRRESQHAAEGKGHAGAGPRPAESTEPIEQGRLR